MNAYSREKTLFMYWDKTFLQTLIENPFAFSGSFQVFIVVFLFCKDTYGQTCKLGQEQDNDEESHGNGNATVG